MMNKTNGFYPVVFMTFLLSAWSNWTWACDRNSVSWDDEDQRITVTGEVTCTLTDIYSALEAQSLDEVIGTYLVKVDEAQGVWYLDADLLMEDGGSLVIHGSDADEPGDTNILYLSSANNAFHSINAEWGNIHIDSTKIFGWDMSEGNLEDVQGTGGYHTEHEQGRSYIKVRSIFDDDGVTPLESRMDVLNSEIAYLGYYENESFGLTWKVANQRYTENDFGDFDVMNVYGDMKNNYIHHCFRGQYSWGLADGIIDNNTIYYSDDYGVDPHDDSDNLVITNNDIRYSGFHGVICSRRCNDIVIANNYIAFSENGIMLHDLIVDSEVYGNTVVDSRNSGIVIYDSSNNLIYDNVLRRNFRGIRAMVGAFDNHFYNNQVYDSEEYGLFVFQGSTPSRNTDGRPRNNLFYNNHFENNPKGIFFLDADENEFYNNTLVTEDDAVMVSKSSQGNWIHDNNSEQTQVFKGRGVEAGDSSTLVEYLDGLVVDLDQYSSAQFEGEYLWRLGDNVLPVNKVLTNGQILLSLAEGKAFGSGELIQTDIKVSSSDELLITPESLEASDLRVQVKLSSENQTAQFNLYGLAPNSQFDVRLNGVAVNVDKVSTSGVLAFSIVASASDGDLTLTVTPRSSDESAGSFFLGFGCLLVLLLAFHRRGVLQ
jgi:poly(beta-D-mannuronate) C5 epimerase